MKYILTTAFFLLFSLFAPSAYAEDYIIKPIILVPNDFKEKYSEHYLDNVYKPTILNTLETVQQFYANRLNGSTFTYSNDIKIIYSNQDTPPGANSVFDFFWRLSGPFWIFEEGNTKPVYTIWVVGSEGVAPNGGEVEYKFTRNFENVPILQSFGANLGLTPSKYTYRIALMNHQSLLVFNPGETDTFGQHFSFKSLAHELGHAFGVNYSDYAKHHPCTEVSQEWCTDYAKSLNIFPVAEEWTTDVMGYIEYDLSKATLSNSTYNPEISKLCQSPYLHPFWPNCPEPQTPQIPPPRANVTALSYEEVSKGGILEIYGENFGERQQVVFRNLTQQSWTLTNAEGEGGDIGIIEWSDTLIKIKVNHSEENSDTVWRVVVYPKNSRIGSNTDKIVKIKGHSPPDRSVVWNVKTVCKKGEDYIGFSAPVTLNNQEKTTVLSLTITDANGLGTLGKTYPYPYDIKELLFLKAEEVAGVTSTFGDSGFLTDQPVGLGSPKDYLYIFRYEKCPEIGPDSSFIPKVIQGNGSIDQSTNEFTDEEGNKIPFFAIQLGPDDTGTNEKTLSEARARLAEMQDFNQSLDDLLPNVKDERVRDLILISQGKLDKNSQDLNACIVE